MDPVIVTPCPDSPHVAELVLNRPDKRNAVSYVSLLTPAKRKKSGALDG